LTSQNASHNALITRPEREPPRQISEPIIARLFSIR
jgi:hypothetical protein